MLVHPTMSRVISFRTVSWNISPAESRTKIESLVPVETYVCRKSGDVAAILLQFQLVVPMVHIKMRKYCGNIELIYDIIKCRHDSVGSWNGFICFHHIHIQPYFFAGQLQRYNYRGHPTGRLLYPLNYAVGLEFLQFCFQLGSYTERYSPVGLCNRCYCGVNVQIYLHSFHLSDTAEQICVLFLQIACDCFLTLDRVCHLNNTKVPRGLETYQGLSVRMSLCNMKRGKGDSGVRLNNRLKDSHDLQRRRGLSFDWYARKTLDDLLNITLSASNLLNVISSITFTWPLYPPALEFHDFPLSHCSRALIVFDCPNFLNTTKGFRIATTRVLFDCFQHTLVFFSFHPTTFGEMIHFVTRQAFLSPGWTFHPSFSVRKSSTTRKTLLSSRLALCLLSKRI